MSHCSVECLQWVLKHCNKLDVFQSLSVYDMFDWNPLTLAYYLYQKSLKCDLNQMDGMEWDDTAPTASASVESSVGSLGSLSSLTSSSAVAGGGNDGKAQTSSNSEKNDKNDKNEAQEGKMAATKKKLLARTKNIKKLLKKPRKFRRSSTSSSSASTSTSASTSASSASGGSVTRTGTDADAKDVVADATAESKDKDETQISGSNGSNGVDASKNETSSKNEEVVRREMKPNKGQNRIGSGQTADNPYYVSWELIRKYCLKHGSSLKNSSSDSGDDPNLSSEDESSHMSPTNPLPQTSGPSGSAVTSKALDIIENIEDYLPKWRHDYFDAAASKNGSNSKQSKETSDTTDANDEKSENNNNNEVHGMNGVSGMNGFAAEKEIEDLLDLDLRVPFQYKRGKRLNRRHLLVLVNPFSGLKKGPTYFAKVVKPLFEMSGAVTCDMIETQYLGHGVEIVRNLDLNKYDGVVGMGGDGTLFEIINGLDTHATDPKRALINTGLTLIACGTGNGLVSQLDTLNIYDAARHLINGTYVPFDAFTFMQPKVVPNNNNNNQNNPNTQNNQNNANLDENDYKDSKPAMPLSPASPSDDAPNDTNDSNDNDDTPNTAESDANGPNTLGTLDALDSKSPDITDDTDMSDTATSGPSGASRASASSLEAVARQDVINVGNIDNDANDANDEDKGALARKEEFLMTRGLGFLTLQWGINAVIDFESEQYRWVGPLRIQLKAAVEIAAGTHPLANVYYRPLSKRTRKRLSGNLSNFNYSYGDSDLSDDSEFEELGANLVNPVSEFYDYEEDVKHFLYNIKRRGGTQSSTNTETDENDVKEEKILKGVIAERGMDGMNGIHGINAINAINAGEQGEARNGVDAAAGPQKAGEIKSGADGIKRDAEDAVQTQGKDGNIEAASHGMNGMNGVDAVDAADAGEQDERFARGLPKDWVRVEETEFGLLCACNVSHINQGSPIAGADLGLNDGKMRLVYSTKGKRSELVSLMTKIEGGGHLNSPLVRNIKISECIIEPLQDRPPMDVDGERYPCVPTHCRVVPSLLMLSV